MCGSGSTPLTTMVTLFTPDASSASCVRNSELRPCIDLAPRRRQMRSNWGRVEEGAVEECGLEGRGVEEGGVEGCGVEGCGVAVA